MDVVPRAGWTNVPADTSQMDYREGPAHYVFYTHTAETGTCQVTSCCSQLLNIQHLHMNVRRELCLGYLRNFSAIQHTAFVSQYDTTTLHLLSSFCSIVHVLLRHLYNADLNNES